MDSGELLGCFHRQPDAFAFGETVASSGIGLGTFLFGANSGYRDDGDAGLVQVGCRYLRSRNRVCCILAQQRGNQQSADTQQQ